MDRAGKFPVFVLVAAVLAFSAWAGQPSRIKIVYRGFGEAVDVDGHRLNYSFGQQSSTPRTAVRELTAEQEALFVDWMDRCRIFSLTKPDVLVPDPNHPGAQEFYSLLVEYGDKKIDLTWRGISRWNDSKRMEMLDTGLEELVKLASRLTR